MAESKTTMSAVEMDDGIHLHVKILGDDSTTKPLFIGLHGAPGLSTHAEPAVGFGFLSKIFRVLVFDARGSGTSDLTGPFTHDRWVKDIENLRYLNMTWLIYRRRRADLCFREWAGADKIILSGGSYGGTIALDYAILHSDKLLGLLLRDTWTNGVLIGMTALAAIVTSPRLKVDVARQVRVWSGTLRDDKDYEAAVQEIIPIYAPPGTDKDVQKDFEGMDESSRYNSATQNFAFAVNMPRFDVRRQLKNIKVREDDHNTV